MPPLLPEYLSQPLQIMVEASSTDWCALIAAGLFTLVGAGLGAWYGGRSAYNNAVKAHNAAIKRQKLEEALALVLDIESQAGPLSRAVSMIATSEGWVTGEKDRIRELGENINLDSVIRLNVLLQVYDDSQILYHGKILHINLMRLKFQAKTLGAKSYEVEKQDIQTFSLSAISKSKTLREELISYLRL